MLGDDDDDEGEYDENGGDKIQLDKEHASSTAFHAPTSTLLRLLSNNRTLEIRYVGFMSPGKDITTKQQVVRLRFPSPLRDLFGSAPFYFDPQTGALTVLLLDTHNYLFRLNLPSQISSTTTTMNNTRQNIYQIDSNSIKRILEEYQVDESKFEGLGTANGGKLVWSVTRRDGVVVGVREGLVGIKVGRGGKLRVGHLLGNLAPSHRLICRRL